MEQLIHRAALDLANSKYAIALTGAGISTESGIPDFRGPQGVWTKNPEAEKAAYMGYQRFQEDPKQWWVDRMASTGVLGDMDIALPNAGHYALVELEEADILKCVITQNVDALHETAGSKNLLEYHGSRTKLRCIGCGARFPRASFDLEKLLREESLPPECPECGGLIKTDGVGFGESIPSQVASGNFQETLKCDLMLICGTSAVVYPFAQLPRIAKQRALELENYSHHDSDDFPTVKIIEINAELTPLTDRRGVRLYYSRSYWGNITEYS